MKDNATNNIRSRNGYFVRTTSQIQCSKRLRLNVEKLTSKEAPSDNAKPNDNAAPKDNPAHKTTMQLRRKRLFVKNLLFH